MWEMGPGQIEGAPVECDHNDARRTDLAMGFPDLLSGLFASRDTRQDAEGVYAGAIEIPADEEAPDWIRLLQTGEYLNHPDGPHEVTRQHLEEIVENFGRTQVDLLVDKDHDSLFKGDTRAAGWIMEMEIREDGLYGRWPEWTPWGEELVGSREYRYLSPVYSLTSKAKDGTDQGARMHSVSLTNVPYMDTGEVDAISSPAGTDNSPSDTTTDTDPDRLMDRDELIDLLDLDEEATDDEIEEALQEMKEAKSDEDDEPASSDEDPSDSDKDQELEEVVNSIRSELKDLKEEREEDQAEQLVNAAVEDGKIAPAQKAVYLNAARADYDETKKQLDQMDDGQAMPDGVKTGDADPNDNTKANRRSACVDYIKAEREAAA